MSLRLWSTLGGILLSAAVYGAASYGGLSAVQSWTAAVTALCAAW
jgi:hypothetical protein